MNNFAQKFTAKATWGPFIATLLLPLALFLLFYGFLGSRPLLVPDEGRYAEIAREMAELNNFITPYLNYIKYFEKPPLFYWLETVVIKTLGTSLGPLRAINATLGLLGCFFTYRFGKRILGREHGLMAAFILGTSALYVIMARMISLDLPVTFFIMAGLYLNYLGFTTESRHKHYFAWGAAFFALATLTKGLIGIIFPSLILLTWLVLRGSWRKLLSYPWKSTLIIYFLLTIPWHLLVSVQNPEFFHFYFIEQHFLRYLEKNVGHYQPNWFFIPVILVGALPWSLFLPIAFYRFLRGKGDRSLNAFLWSWIIIIFLFFSFSKSKLIPYVLPLFPAIALVTANEVLFFLKQQSRKAQIIMAIILFAFLVANLIIVDKISRDRSVLALIPHINLDNPSAQILTYNRYYQDLPFYLAHKVNVLNWRNELSFGADHQQPVDWLLDTEAFWAKFHGSHPLYVIIGEDELQAAIKTYPNEKFRILSKHLNTLLLLNKN